MHNGRDHHCTEQNRITWEAPQAIQPRNTTPATTMVAPAIQGKEGMRPCELVRSWVMVDPDMGDSDVRTCDAFGGPRGPAAGRLAAGQSGSAPSSTSMS